MKRLFISTILTVTLLSAVNAQQLQTPNRMGNLEAETEFEKISSLAWLEKFRDSGRNDWRDGWFADGEKQTLRNTPEGLIYNAGTTPLSDEDHTVLWTKQNFKGNIKVEFNYTRTDTLDRFVNIIYIHAQGSGADGYAQDISQWNDKRRIPSMSIYFNHMNAYHISYGAFENELKNHNSEYIRGRQYRPESGNGLTNTALTPEYNDISLFRSGGTYHVTVIKYDAKLYMKVTDRQKEKSFYFTFDIDPARRLNSGRIGLRQMCARKAIYSDVVVSEISND